MINNESITYETDIKKTKNNYIYDISQILLIDYKYFEE